MGKASRSKRQRKARAAGGGFSVVFGADGADWRPEDAVADAAANAQDRARFAALPGVVGYLRPPEPGELRATIPPGCDLAAVEVRQIAPGVRVRLPHFRALDPEEIN
jgi:hypothetical protein